MFKHTKASAVLKGSLAAKMRFDGYAVARTRQRQQHRQSKLRKGAVRKARTNHPCKACIVNWA